MTPDSVQKFVLKLWTRITERQTHTGREHLKKKQTQNARTLLKWISEKCSVRMRTEFFCRATVTSSRLQWPVVGYSELIHSVVCLTTGPWTLPKRISHMVRSSASSFNFLYPLVCLRSSSSRLRLLPRLPFTSILPFIFLSITCFRGHFPRNTLQIQSAFPLLILCTIFVFLLASL